MEYLSDLLGARLRDEHGKAVGDLTDVVVQFGGDQAPPVAGLVIRRSSCDWFLGCDRPPWLSTDAHTITVASLVPFERHVQEVLLAHDLLDHQVIDLPGVRIGRVNDVLLSGEGGAWQLHGVDLGTGALLRRLLPNTVRPRPADGRVLVWPEFEIFACEIAGGLVRPDHRHLAQLHPADIARITDLVPTVHAQEIIESLSDELAADTLEEMIEQLQANVIIELSSERAAAILACMAPNAAADLLAELPPAVVSEVLQRLPPAAAADLHGLLTYDKHTAGGLMTTDYVLAPRGLRVSQAPEFLRAQMKKPDWVYYIYIVEDLNERKLLGVLSLRDLLLASPEQAVEETMAEVLRTTQPDASASEVARTMSEYNLMALPVVDADGRLLGIVSVDDALEVILPANLRRSLPRVFS